MRSGKLSFMANSKLNGCRSAVDVGIFPIGKADTASAVDNEERLGVQFAIGLPQFHRLLLVLKQRNCMNISVRAVRPVVIAAVALVASLAAQAALPEFPAHSLLPLYGEWVNAMGRDPAPMSIGPTWMTSAGAVCPQRTRYKVLSVAPVTIENETNLEITIQTYGEEFVGKMAMKTYCAARLQRGGYVRFHILDQAKEVGEPIAVFWWSACDTLDHLNQFTHPNVQGCTAGSIMDRVTSHQLEHPH
jgi:hypothetical protein